MGVILNVTSSTRPYSHTLFLSPRPSSYSYFGHCHVDSSDIMANEKQSRQVVSPIQRRRARGRKTPGSAPGTVLYTGEQRLETVTLTVVDYDEEHVDKRVIDDIEEARPYLDDPSKTWVQVYGLHDVEKLKAIWSYFNLHPLVQEDIVSTAQRPKVEQYADNIYFVLRMLTYDAERYVIDSEQVSIVLGKNYVLSFQESDAPIFSPVLERLNIEGTRLRTLGPDYLAYALIDTIVDHYFRLLEQLGDRVEDVEEELVEDTSQEIFQTIHALRRKLILFRKAVWPLRDALNTTVRDDSPFIQDKTKVYLRDVYDHVVQIIDSVEQSRDMVMSLHDMYMTQVSNRMNEIMKVLTIIATIFIPLTFVAGVYGMNFNPEVSPWNMPELNWSWGYPAVMVVMLVIALLMVAYFRKKEWL